MFRFLFFNIAWSDIHKDLALYHETNSSSGVSVALCCGDDFIPDIFSDSSGSAMANQIDRLAAIGNWNRNGCIGQTTICKRRH